MVIIFYIANEGIFILRECIGIHSFTEKLKDYLFNYEIKTRIEAACVVSFFV